MLEKAQKLVEAGKGGAVLEHIDPLNCPDSSATADSFVSYYGQDPRLDTSTLIPKIGKPTLVVVVGNDDVVVGLDKKLAPFVDGKRVQMRVIEGAGRFFRDLYADDAVGAIDAFQRDRVRIQSTGFIWLSASRISSRAVSTWCGSVCCFIASASGS